ncbi:CDP-glycerol glycerophosphotransferase family protein [Limosilactobacillus fermentum]|uniref:CDP-glycerol glycerophosphotransferase family protein n=1 Tax=Limosilactobacillus fermentum TaxID=1613 RepID=UPI00210F748B|nr:CDP-glycerol glycerophosphotransferase family protein [Limosilactobacillus fermentum]UUC15467.1 CDP-glycerol glycerophosphotransferase family protein [Limosilactobacillus fermentum]
MERIRQKLFLVKYQDFVGFIMVILAVIPAVVLKLRDKKIWLLCERSDEARDNAYAFFRYLQENKVEAEAYYAIEKNSSDSHKLKAYGSHVINFGSLKHYVYWLACDANISSVKNSGPNNLIGYAFRKLNLMNKKQIFLQHGIIFNDLKWLHYDQTKIGTFVSNAGPEYQFIKDRFGYPERNLIKTSGQCRYDDLFTKDPYDFNYLLVMPTWRKWLKPGDPDMKIVEETTTFSQTHYYRNWMGLINDSRVHDILRQYNLKLVFYPHPTMQEYVEYFNGETNNFILADSKNWDIQRLIRNAQMLLTDYSSVYFDFVYQEKPVISYQFDLDKFHQNHYSPGYLPYDNNPFFKSSVDEKAVIDELSNYLSNECQVSDRYVATANKFFPIKDQQNRQRLYQQLYQRLYK